MIACYGEALIDLIVSPYSRGDLRTNSQACLGGSIFNFCIAAKRQHLQVLYLNALSHDSFGRQFADILQSEGVQLDAPTPCAEPTSIAVVQLDFAGKASYAFHREGVADTARSAAEIIANWPQEISTLHTGCLMLIPSQWPQTRQIVERAAAQGCVISVDSNLRPAICSDALSYRESVLAACRMAHVVKVSDDDLVALGLLAAADLFETNAAVQAARGLFNEASQTHLVALTLGERGAWLLTRDGSLYQPAPSGVVVKDTVGAGDSFAAALLAHLHSQALLSVKALRQGLKQEALQSTLRHAVAAAAICVQRTGCDPASWDEAEILVNQAL
jgi:fructokinase